MDFVIGHFRWGQAGPFPEVKGSLTADACGLALAFDVREEEIRAVNSIHNRSVCEDSCAEFFCAPFPSDPRYINIEINPIGTTHFAIGEGRHNRTLLPLEYIRALEMKTAVDRGDAEARWQVRFILPYELLAAIFGLKRAGPLNAIRCNFYKCGDKLKRPHWGSWSPVLTERPDFHRPEYFAEAVI